MGSYLFNKYIETIHVSTIYVDDDCLLHIYNKGVVTTSKVKGLFTVLLKKPGLPNPTCQQLISINNDISYLGINISEEGGILCTSHQPGYVQHIIDSSYPNDHRIHNTSRIKDGVGYLTDIKDLRIKILKLDSIDLLHSIYFDVSFPLKDMQGLIDDGILIIAMLCNCVYVKQLRYFYLVTLKECVKDYYNKRHIPPPKD